MIHRSYGMQTADVSWVADSHWMRGAHNERSTYAGTV